jgi:hypothetical protein
MVLRDTLSSGDVLWKSEGRDRSGSVEAPYGSPFIEGTRIQWAWDATSLAAFKRCPRYYALKIVEGWGAGDGEAPIHLRWGIEYHHALEAYDRFRFNGANHDDALRDTLRDTLERIETWDPDPRTASEALKTKYALIRSIVWYAEHFREDPASTIRLRDGSPAVELNFNFALDFGPSNETNQPSTYHLCGYLDRIVEFNGDVYAMDRKSSTTTPGSYYFRKFDLDEQMTVYSIASQIILSSPIRGVIIDAVQVAENFSRYTRGFTYRTPDQLEEWFGDLHWWLKQAEDCARTDFWPANLTSCDKYGGCEFREICAKSPAVRQRFLKSSFKQGEKWNPLKPR